MSLFDARSPSLVPKRLIYTFLNNNIEVSVTLMQQNKQYFLKNHVPHIQNPESRKLKKY